MTPGRTVPDSEQATTPNLFGALVDGLGKLLAPIRHAVEDPGVLSGLLARIGATTEHAGGDALANALASLVDLANQIEQLSAKPSPSLADIAAVLETSGNAFTALRGLSAAGGSAEALEDLGADLANLLILLYLWNRNRLAYKLAVLATLIQPANEADPRAPVISNGTVLRKPFQLDQFRLRRLGDLLRDPAGMLRGAYATPLATVGDANAMADKLFPRLREVLRELGVSCRYGFDPADAPLLNNSAPIVDHSFIVYMSDPLLGAGIEAGVVLTLSSADRGDLGLVVSPFGTLTATLEAGKWDIEVDLTADVEAFAYGRHGLTLLASPGTAEVGAKLSAMLPPPADGPAFMVGSATGSRVEVGGANVIFQTLLSEAHQAFAVSADVSKSALVIASGDGDGFLSSILPGDGLRADFDLGLAWSHERGLTLRGSAGLDAILPIGRSIDGVILSSVHLTLQARDVGVAGEVSASVAVSMGPVNVIVDRVGIAAEVTFPEDGGNLGVANLRFGFKSPTSLGLTIDAGPVSGGGFLGFDPVREEYSGALELQFGTVGVKAIGLLSTGPGDWSLLLLLYAQIPPIEIGFGFLLEGVGGLIGLQRGADITALIAGMKTKAFDDILFPADPVRDAPRILDRLRVLFPARAGALTIGPMLDVGWGAPRIVFIRVAVIVQLDNVLGSTSGPVRLTQIVLAGQVRVVIGRADDDPGMPVLQLIVDILGFWDLTDKRFGFLATLYDSHVTGIDLTGGLGVWGEYGEHTRFLLAAGGFNPRFQDIPAEMSGRLDRLGASFSVGVFSLVLTGYFALTPATIQAGLNLHASGKVGPVGIRGDIGFDVLVYRRPRTHFIADFHIIAEITYHGHTLAGVKVTGTIEGPSQWHLTGKVTFSILWWDISKSFDESWGSQAALEITVIDVAGLLATELARRENWSAQLPPGAEAMVTLAPHQGDLAPRAHPLGRLVFSQRAVPLGLTLDKYGENAITGPNHFDLTSVTIRHQPLTQTTPVREHFARAQFLDMTDDEKLTRPSFEEMDAGVEFSSTTFEISTHPAAVNTTMEYETAYLDLTTQQTHPDPTPALKTAGLDYQDIETLARTGAAARAPQRAHEHMRTKTQLQITVNPPPLAATDRATLTTDHTTPLHGQASTVHMIAEQHLHTTHTQIIETYELTGT